MRTDGIFNTAITSVTVPNGGSVTLVPFGDIHFRNPNHCENQWKKFVERYKDREDCIFLGMGDYGECFSTSERKGIAAAGLHESSEEVLNKLSDSWLDEDYESLKWMNEGGRLRGMLGGNHFYKYPDGTTSDQRLAARLGVPYLGCFGVVYAKLSIAKAGSSCVVRIVAYHGKGGGQLIGSPINNVEKLSQFIDGDIYLMGDSHDKGTLPDVRLYPYFDTKNNRVDLKARGKIYGRTGSFLRAYVPGKPSYITDRALKPKALGNVEIQIIVKREQIDKKQELSYELRGTA